MYVKGLIPKKQMYQHWGEPTGSITAGELKRTEGKGVGWNP